MAINLSGMTASVEAGIVSISVSNTHPLLRLGRALDWKALSEVVAWDLKNTTAKGFWWLGRNLFVRIHLAAYLLQVLYNLSDRQIEYGIKDNAAFQLFCGMGIVDGWRAPDHTKIEEFRSRLSPETQRTLANALAKLAVFQGLADPSETDFDSTVQEANIAYPADVNLMSKLAILGKKVITYCIEKVQGLLPGKMDIDIQAIRRTAREYFFLSKNTVIEKRREVFAKLHALVNQQMQPIIDFCARLQQSQLAVLPWNIRKSIDQIQKDAAHYLRDVAHFMQTGKMKEGKILSLWAKAVAYINKKKIKGAQFGRVFQLGRIKGNFLFVLQSTSLRMNDKDSLTPLLAEHSVLFGEGTLRSVATDKGYWSNVNRQAIINKPGMQESGLQHPSNIKNLLGVPSQGVQDKLRDRRAGIEPLIGHVKQGGQLGRSRMKSDRATLAAGYASVLGFNLRQLMKKQGQPTPLAA